tara:strand:+ start:2017 stop:2529 length:513 start_codon:yes stop_codon:yes gene_type:complete
MIRSIVLTGVSALCIMLGANKNKTDLLKIYHDLPQKINVEEPKINKDLRLINALIQVESNGNDSCIGDRHLIIPSVGCLQIRPIMVREVNRILAILGDNTQYKNKDRYSHEKSIEMFLIWKNFHHKDHSNEVIARSWNGGPKGPLRKRTIHYWYKVQKELSKNSKDSLGI